MIPKPTLLSMASKPSWSPKMTALCLPVSMCHIVNKHHHDGDFYMSTWLDHVYSFSKVVKPNSIGCVAKQPNSTSSQFWRWGARDQDAGRLGFSWGLLLSCLPSCCLFTQGSPGHVHPWCLSVCLSPLLKGRCQIGLGPPGTALF